MSKYLDNYQYLAWIKNIKNDKYLEAAHTLNNLAVNENDSFMKQRTLTSMSKLSMIANGNEANSRSFDHEMAALNRRLEYLAYIEYLAPSISKNYGFTLDQISAYKAEKLIGLYIADPEATEVEFRKAFELIHFLNDDKSTVRGFDLYIFEF